VGINTLDQDVVALREAECEWLKLSKIRVADESFNLHTSLVLKHIFASTKIEL